MGDSHSNNPGHSGSFGRPFDVEEVAAGVGRTNSTDNAPALDGYIKDLERIPPLEELRALWERSMSKILPHRR
jgi:hypothetical protein